MEGFVTGGHRSPYHGFAVEFAEHRPYVPGDDLRHIDWKVWSKTDRLYLKQFEEETNLSATVLLDCSRSMRYGEGQQESGAMGKFDYARTLAACLAYLLQHQQDSVGLVAFDHDVRLSLPAGSHPSHLKQMMHELEQLEADHRTELPEVFTRLAERVRRRGLIILVSDLFAPIEQLSAALRQFQDRGHELVVFHVLHRDELEFPFQDNTLFRAMEEQGEVLTEPRALRRAYLEQLRQYLAEVRRLCAEGGMDYVRLNTAEPLDAALSEYLAFRRRTHRRVRRRGASRA